MVWLESSFQLFPLVLRTWFQNVYSLNKTQFNNPVFKVKKYRRVILQNWFYFFKMTKNALRVSGKYYSSIISIIFFPTDINECLQQPCLHGSTCVNTPGSYTCTCAPGWTGPNCAQDINECLGILQCLNGGTCINTPGSYTCICPTGWTGDMCDLGR